MYNDTPPSFVKLAGRLLLAASIGLLGCERQPDAPQDPYAVTLEQAQQVAEHLTNTNVAVGAAKLKTVSGHFILMAGQAPALYIFNYKEGGFSIIAADKHLMPVLAYSTSSVYTNSNKPGGLLLWERKTVQTVADARAVTTPAPDESVTTQWVASLSTRLVLDGTASAPVSNSVPADGPPQSKEYIVGPLLPVTWGQGCTYNEQCPSGTYCNTHTPTGCVMTAMAQVMAYWRYPTSYNWASMPTNYGNAEVQRLMVDAGSSMQHSDYQSATTGARLEEAAGQNGNGFRNSRFQYKSSSYVNYDYNVVKANIGQLRPVILDGCDDRTNEFVGLIYS